MTTTMVKMRAGKYRIPVGMEKRGKRIFFHFGFNQTLKDDIRALEGAKWHGYDEKKPEKVWSVEDTQHNDFQLKYLMSGGADNLPNPYAPYNTPLLPLESRKGRPFYKHQKEMFAHVLQRMRCILACEMGTGKTLVAIEAIEYAVEELGWDPHDFFYVAPKNALEAVKFDFGEWKCDYRPHFMTYDGLVKTVREWQPGHRAPRVLILDESSRLKNHMAQRSIGAKHIADAMRAEYGDQCMIILMSGSPAPKSPADWWQQCEIACPGFLKEGSIVKAKNRLAIIVQVDSDAGGKYPRLVTWLDNADKCRRCGNFKDKDLKGSPYAGHDDDAAIFGIADGHSFAPSKNEVEYLYARMNGLVLVKFKKDCLDLPPKTFRTIKVKPKAATLNALKAIMRRCSTTIQALTLARELSDGFQYKEEPEGMEPCEGCNATGEVLDYFYIDDEGTERHVVGTNLGPGDVIEPGTLFATGGGTLQHRLVTCSTCDGKKEVVHFVREQKPVACPKLDVVEEILEDLEDIGRCVIYAGFQASVDRVIGTCIKMGWQALRIDGRGWHLFDESGVIARDKQELIRIFRFGQEENPKVCVVAQADSAGMGLNFSSSPTIVHFSATFNAESYIQATERTQRAGAEITLAKMAALGMAPKLEIIKIVHLPTDEYVFENLEKKQRLQDQTMGALKNAIDRFSTLEDRAL